MKTDGRIPRRSTVLSAMFVLSALLLAAELTNLKGGLIPAGEGGPNPTGGGSTTTQRGLGTLIIRLMLVTEPVPPQAPTQGPALVPIWHLKVNITREDQVTRPIVLYTNRSGLITQPLSRGLYAVSGGDATFTFSEAVNVSSGQITHMNVNVTRASHPASFLLLNDNDGSGRLDTWESAIVLVPNDTSYTLGQIVYLRLTGIAFSERGGDLSGGNVTLTIRSVVTGSHLGLTGTWVTLKPDVGFPMGDYSSFNAITNEPRIQVTYSIG